MNWILSTAVEQTPIAGQKMDAMPSKSFSLAGSNLSKLVGHKAHFSGRIAAALGEHASTLLAAPPVIERIDVRAAKLP